MPAKNNHTVSIPDVILAQAGKLAGRLGTLLELYAIKLTPDERHGLVKMGDKPSPSSKKPPTR
jgi:hypothetical protein